jgi:phosphoglycerate-specific signal transduction histidine kinase
MTEEIIAAILQRLERIENLLERMDGIITAIRQTRLVQQV